MKLTTLEKDILRWIVDHCEDPTLRTQLGCVEVTRRDYTGHGLFVYLSVPTNILPISGEESEDVTPIPGPNFTSPQLQHGGGSVIFITDGFVDCLEFYGYGESFPQEITAYELT